jgi:diguanylate cyclase (GGDEF)-like protein
LASSRATSATDQRLKLLVGLVVLLGTAALGTSLVVALADLLDGGPAPSWAAVASVVALVAVGDLLDVKVRVRSARHGITWADAAIVIGLATTPVPWVVIATVAGITLASGVRRHPPMKFAFGVAKESVTAAAGGLVLLGLGVAGSIEVRDLAALGAAFVAMTVVDELLVIPVIAAASRTRVADRFRMNWDIRLATAAGRFAVATGVVLALQVEETLLYGLPVPVIIAHVWHERWVRTREERQAWQTLAQATERFTGVDLDVVLREAVLGGVKLFSADEIEIEVWLDHRDRLVRGGEEITFDGDPGDVAADGADVYAMPLHGYPGRRDIGVLRLRFLDQIKISEREEAMLSAYAAALDTAIRNATAYRRLGEATAAHAHAAAHDALTGLPNRRELERHLTEALTSPSGDAGRIGLVLLDLRHFKEVNDALGHLAGDRVLAMVAQRLRAAAAAGDVVTRFGGDEFAILLRSARRWPEAETRALALMASLSEPLEVDGLPIIVEANGGVALAVDANDEPDLSAELQRELDEPGTASTRAAPQRPAFRNDPETWKGELMRRADVAMYQAKRAGRRLACYAQATDPADRDRLTLAGQLSRAVAEREFVLHFQPIVDIASGEVVGAEALARWRHPTRGQLQPRWFLDLLERSAQLPAFTAAVLDDALAAADTWRAAGHDLSVSVNISARSVLDTSLPRQVRAALDRHRTPPDRLCLELTETLALSQLDTVDQVLTRLYEMGVRLSLDDFGTGLSSIGVLSRIPVHEIKIDRSFVGCLATAGTDAVAAAQARAVVRSTIQLGRTLELGVVAEGIESELQRVMLWELGCALGQGHMFAKAVPADQLLALLTRGVAGRPGTLATSLRPESNRQESNVVRLPRKRDSGKAGGDGDAGAVRRGPRP